MNWRTIVKRYPQIKGNDKQVEMLKSGKKEEIEKVCLGYMLAIYNIAKRSAKNEEHLDDLMQEGYTGVMRAAEKFDPSLGVKFHTYATYWIKERIYNQEYNRLVRVPTAKWQLVQKFKRLEEKLSEGGVVPHFKEIVKHMTLKGRQEEDLWAALQQPYSEQVLKSDEGEEYGYDIPDKYDLVEDVCNREEQQKLDNLIKTQLTDQERLLLKLRQDDKSRREVAEIMGLTQAKVTQMERAIHDILRAGVK